jgi:hypothetical protein
MGIWFVSMKGTCTFDPCPIRRNRHNRHAVPDWADWFCLRSVMSTSINCENRAEVDDLWVKRSEGGEEGRYGWPTGRFGIS